MWYLYGALLFLAFLLLLYIAVCHRVFCFAFLRSKPDKRELFDVEAPGDEPFAALAAEGVRYASSLPYEAVYITARDGLRLFAKLFTPAESPRATILLFHGYRSFPEHDFGGILRYYLEECHFRILMPDQRAHGESEGKYITFGTLERHDCADWAHWVARRFGPNEKCILDGMSMGASTVLLAAGECLPENIVGILADCGYTSPDAILRTVGRRMHLPVALLLPGVYFLCRVHGFSPRGVSAPVVLAASRYPLLLIHGMADDFVPYEMGLENYRAAAGEKQMLSVPDAGHGASFVVDREAVMQALAIFFARVLGDAS